MKQSFYKVLCIILGVVFFLTSCQNHDVSTPKPRMYPRVMFPERKDTLMDKDYCDFTFVYPNYLEFIQDTNFFEEKPLHPCWFNLHSKNLNSTIHCSYYPIHSTKDFDNLVQDAFEMAGKHNIKANFRKEALIDNGTDVHGLVFEIDGPVASPLQFYITDSTSHFFRASLYFDAKVNPDSTKIIYDYLKTDIDHIISTFQWNTTSKKK